MEPRSLEGLTVLVVDDHEDTRMMFAEYLAWHGAHPIPVEGVVQAIVVLEAIAVDVVVTDVAMPRADGYELIARMDVHPVWARIPRVIASGQSSPEEASDRAANAVYLCKPVALDDLVRAVEQAHGALFAEGRSGVVGGV
jgi:CheY-like chemotaxis protein